MNRLRRLLAAALDFAADVLNAALCIAAICLLDQDAIETIGDCPGD